MDGRGSERRGADAGAAVMAVTKWANPGAPATLQGLKVSTQVDMEEGFLIRGNDQSFYRQLQ
ncbi:MAG: hypothetical protein R6V21_07615 [Pelovirga sp.]